MFVPKWLIAVLFALFFLREYRRADVYGRDELRQTLFAGTLAFLVAYWGPTFLDSKVVTWILTFTVFFLCYFLWYMIPFWHEGLYRDDTEDSKKGK